jgi:glucose/arabinose dehydrogenase
MDAAVPDSAGGGLDATMDTAMDAPVQSDVAALDGGQIPKNTCVGPSSAALANAGLPPGYCAWTWASGLGTPRGITRNAKGDIIVVERGSGSITLLHDDNGNGVSDSTERVVLTTMTGLNHGVAINGGYLYASSTTTVYRWAYDGGRAPLGSPQTVVTGLPSGGHNTRTLLFDGEGRLYVSVGSGSNVDSNSSRARIVRYPASALASSSTFAQGEVFADGLRNEVGLALDGKERVWGVENGRDDLSRSDVGGDIHDDNPGEELNLFSETGKFYGYPYCWSEFLLSSGMGPGTQWADPQFMNDGTHTDAWCRSAANVVAPVLVLQAHTAPLDIKFYDGGAFPDDMNGSAIVSNHGSWNRTPPTGYKVVAIPFGPDGMPSGEPRTLLEYAGSGDTGSNWPHRPVGIQVGADGRLFVTSDASNIVIAVGYKPPA